MISLLGSCISQNKIKLLQDKSVKEVSNNFINSKRTTYKIQSGDHLYVKVYSVDPKTSKFFQTDFPTLMNPTYLYLNSYVVDEEGFINFSFVDKMYVKGLTVPEVKTLIQKTLSEYFKETTVVVKLVNFQVAILGEVNNPGDYTIDKDQINIFQALGLAGGIKDFANIKKITLVRQTTTGSDIQHLDLSDNKILSSDYYYLMPNDVIYIEPLNIKSYAYNKFPYELLISIVTTAAVFYTIFRK
jgi:polysaccharide export outer membrane protein